MSGLRVGIVGVVASAAAVVGLAMSEGGGRDQVETTGRESPATDAGDGARTVPSSLPEDLRRWNRPALEPGPIPAGKEPIIFNDGGVPGLAGFVDAEGLNGWDVPDPVLDLGSGRYEVRGDVVTGYDGEILGFAISTVGLVDLATASDPEALDELLAKGAAQMAEGGDWMTEEEAEEVFGVDPDPTDDSAAGGG